MLNQYMNQSLLTPKPLHMMRIFFITLLIANFGYLTAQDQLIGEFTTSGATISNSSNTIDFNVGNLLIGEVSNSQQTVLHGLLPYALKVTALAADEISDLVVSVYPNPVISKLSVDHKESLPLGTLIEVRDINGALMSSKTIETTATKSEIDMSDIANGTYLLMIKTRSGQTNLYRIIKQ